MAIDCIIDYDCKVRETLNTTFKFHMLTLDGETEIKDYKVSDLLESTLPLEALQKHCEPCPASGGKRFGCYTAINYPISGKAESWLADTSRRTNRSKERFDRQ